jgi:hypothetical protein
LIEHDIAREAANRSEANGGGGDASEKSGDVCGLRLRLRFEEMSDEVIRSKDRKMIEGEGRIQDCVDLRSRCAVVAVVKRPLRVRICLNDHRRRSSATIRDNSILNAAEKEVNSTRSDAKHH